MDKPLKCKIFKGSIDDVNSFMENKNINGIETLKLNGVDYIVVYYN